MQNFDDLKAFFNNHNFKKNKSEDNFFNLGSRRFYENPFTEVLGYILDSETQFSGRKEFIEILLKDSIPEESLNSLIKFAKVSTQVSTDNRKCIDLVFYNDSDIVVFENKIFHSANNPFDDYFLDIKNKYPAHQHYFILLSYKKEDVVENWHYVSIQEKFFDFNTTYRYEFKNKWDYFIQDFISHFSNKKVSMDTEEKKFYEAHFAKIISAGNNLNHFLLDIGNSFIESNSLQSFEIEAQWNMETKAIRFYPFSDKSNVVLIFNPDGTFSTSVYYYKDYKKHNTDIYNRVGRPAYYSWPEQSICCFTLWKGQSFISLRDALAECTHQVLIMKSLYEEKFS